MRKNIFLFAAMLAIAAGCVRDIEESVEDQGLSFTASFGPETKVVINDNGKVYWKSGDAIAVSDGVYSSYVALSDKNITENGKSASFSVTDLQYASKYYAVHPYGSAPNPAPDADGFVKLYYLQYGRPSDYTYQTCCAVAGPDRSFLFKNPYSLLCIYDAPYNVEFRSDVELFSCYCFNPETGEMKPLAGSETVKSFALWGSADKDGRLLIPLPSGITFPNGFQLYDINAKKTFFSTTEEFKTVRNKIYVIGEEESVIIVGTAGTVSGEGAEFEVDVTHNNDIKVIPSEDWVKYIGEENGRLKFTAEYNYCPERKATVTVSDRDGKVNPVTFEVTQTESRFRQGLMKIYNAMDGPNWTRAEGWGTDAPFNTWTGVSGRNSLIFADYQGIILKGEFPDCFEYFGDDLTYFSLSGQKGITGTLPPSFAKLTKLETFVINNTGLTGMPDYFAEMDNLKLANIGYNPNMSGSLPSHLGDKDGMTGILITQTGLTGEIPASWMKNFDVMTIYMNNFTFESLFPDYGAEENNQKIFKYDQNKGYGIDVTGRDFKAGHEGNAAKDIVTGKPIDIPSVIKANKYTVLLHWTTWCPFSKDLMPQLVKYYDKYHKDGFEMVAYSSYMGHNDAPDILETIKEKGYDRWPNVDFDVLESNKYYGVVLNATVSPFAQVFDQTGTLVYSDLSGVKDPVQHRFEHTASTDLIPFLETLFGPLDNDGGYVSTDFSRDGEVTTIQTHTVGNGIDIVFMGDGYTDRDIASGDYDRLMSAAADEFFAIEPYKSFRNRFNVYSVKAVSKNGKVGQGMSTALSCTFPGGTAIEGNLDKCYEYALKVPGITSRNNLLVSVLVNSSRSGGTAHFDLSSQSAVAFTSSVGNDKDYFGHCIRHESGGHGFGFLDDEYVASYTEAPQDYVNYHKDQWRLYGWWANVDFTNDPAKIKWAKFLSDSRYRDEVGIYAGGSTYGYGVWKPSANSMMNENMEYYNAPSREAIYKRIMTLSGEGYTWNKFVQYDAVNRASAARSSAPAKAPLKAAERKEVYHGAAPVVHP